MLHVECKVILQQSTIDLSMSPITLSLRACIYGLSDLHLLVNQLAIFNPSA